MSITCALCGEGAAFASGSLGPFLGPLGSSSLYCHRLCALWSPEVYQTDEGSLRCLQAAVKRGRAMRCIIGLKLSYVDNILPFSIRSPKELLFDKGKTEWHHHNIFKAPLIGQSSPTSICLCRCSHCQARGATIGCRVERCSHSFHLHCARAAGCTFYPAQYVVACTTHAPAFKEEAQKEGCVCRTGFSSSHQLHSFFHNTSEHTCGLMIWT